MNKKGFAISIILYSLVFLLIAVLYMLLAIVKTRYTVTSNLRESIMEQFNVSNFLVDKIMRLCKDSNITYVTKYNASTNGAATDTLDSTDNSDICYYSSDSGDNLADKNGNVIFGDYCWQIVRTTSDSGIKLLYNGPKTSDNKCPESSRPSTVGVRVNSTFTKVDFSGSKIYGTGFEIIDDGGTYVFKLKNTSNYSWSNSSYQNIIGKYVCGISNNPIGDSDTCDYLYYVGSYVSNTEASTTVYRVDTSVNYKQIGRSTFNSFVDSLASVGYMFNDLYNVHNKSLVETTYIYPEINITTPFYYGTKATWNSTTGKYELTVNDGGVDVPPTETLSRQYVQVGMYTCGNTQTSCSTVYYIVNREENDVANYIKLSNGETIDTKKTTWTYSTNYTKNGNNYTLDNPMDLEFYDKDWITDYQNYKNMYVCSNFNSETCTTLYYIADNSKINTKLSTRYNSSTNNYIFGNSITYSGGNYTINNDTNYKQFWTWGTYYNSMANSHYTCFKSDTNNCGNTIYYIYYGDATSAQYIELKNGEKIEDALQKMLNINNNSSSNINRYNSAIKGVIENWYEDHLQNVSGYINENSVYCNDRSIYSLGGWNPNNLINGSNNYLNYKYSSSPSKVEASLNCSKATDQFSVSNVGVAELKYPIGILTEPERVLMGKAYSRAPYDYYLFSPSTFLNSHAMGKTSSNGEPSNTDVNTTNGVRPVIVLKSDVEVSGTGTYDDPYIVGVINGA